MTKYLLAWALLFLWDNGFADIAVCPSKCQCSDDLTIVRCWKQNGYSLPMFPTQTKELYLNNNNLGPVLEAPIGVLQNLEILDISFNAISWIYPHVFNNLTSLKTLILRGNTLTETATGYLAPVKHVRHLDLSQNYFNKLPSKQLYWFQNLTTFNVSFNLLITLQLDDRLHLLKNISVLDFSGNSFTNISRGAFAISSYWNQRIPKFINLSHCNIETTGDGVFEEIPALHELDLGGNTNLSTNTLKMILSDLQETNIKILKLQSMYLTDISSLFVDIHRLALDELVLSENNLVNIPESALNNLMSLKRLVIQKNSLQVLGGITNLGNLKYLDISHNAIELITSVVGESLNKLEFLDISHNNLMGEDNDFSRFQNLIELNIGNNKLIALNLSVVMESLKILRATSNRIGTLPPLNRLRNLRYLDLSSNWLTSLKPFMFPSMNIKIANFSGNKISGPLDNRIFLPRTPDIIDLSYNNLKKIIHCGWKNAQELYLQGNVIRSVDYQSFYAMYNLKHLTLANNQLKEIPENTFQYLINLTTLDLGDNQLEDFRSFAKLLNPLESLKWISLKGNNLTSLETNTFDGCVRLEILDLSQNTIHSIDPTLFNNNEYLQRINLSNNRFVCDCNLIGLRDWIQSTKITLDNKHAGTAGTYVCVNPEEQKDKYIGNFTVEEIECNPNLRYIIVFGSVSGVSLVVVLVSIVVCYFYCKVRQKNIRKTATLNDSKHDLLPKVHGDQIRLPTKKPLPDTDASYHTLPMSNSKSSLSKSNMKSANNKTSSGDPLNVLFSSKEVRFFRRASGSTHQVNNARDTDRPLSKYVDDYSRNERLDGRSGSNVYQSRPDPDDETLEKQYRYHTLPVMHHTDTRKAPSSSELQEQYKSPYKYNAFNGEPRSRGRYALLNYTPRHIQGHRSIDELQERNKWQSLDRYGRYLDGPTVRDHSHIRGYNRRDNRSLLDLPRTDMEYIMNDKRQMRGSSSMGHLSNRYDVIRSERSSGNENKTRTGWL